MLASKMAAVSGEFLAKVGSIDNGLKIESFHITENAGQFRDIFRNEFRKEPGVYWFYLPDGSVYDIGSAVGSPEGNGSSVWKRICAHAPQAVWKGAPGGDREQRTGEGWEFPTCTHITTIVGEDSEATAINAAAQKGTFNVGWAIVYPGHFARLLEVYLQSLCIAVDGRPPRMNFKIG